MTDALFSAIELDDPAPTGYRLHRLEVYNWGTFDRHVWTLAPDGRTSLLTGDIGTGKSTIVDAITTLLLPAHRIAYNKAAGAGTKERSLRSYVEGHYRSERNEQTGTSRPIALRDHHSYSVILGVFVNEGYDETVTLAQVFQQKDRAGQPERFYVVAERDLGIGPDFSDFGDDLKKLKQRLRAGGAAIENTFPDYARRMRRLLSIRSEQAMELFHQTVSMKSVGNLTEFVRNHMLEPADASGRISTIVEHFENLTRSHASVRRATEQLAVLDPLIAGADRYEAAQDGRDRAHGERQALPVFAATMMLAVLHDVRAEAETALGAAQQQQRSVEDTRNAILLRRDALQAERLDAGGDRIARIDSELPGAQTRAQVTTERRARFAALVSATGFPPVDDEASFHDRLAALATARASALDERHVLEERRAPMIYRHGTLKGRAAALGSEIEGLSSRRNNLPQDLVDRRSEICQALQLPETQLPFAGELIDVAEAHSEWRGAAERVLRPFALSLLVPQQHYPAVSAWVNGRHIRSRLVYRRVPERQVRATPASSPNEPRLLHVLELESGPLEDYLRGELVHRAAHRLVPDLAGLQREDRAVTREGLVRDRDRHEKDDRFDITDPKRWVLGRAIERKLAALEAEQADRRAELDDAQRTLDEIEQQDREIQGILGALAGLESYTSWHDIDEASAHEAVERLRAERERLLAGSTRLREIDRQLADLATEQQRADHDLMAATEDVGRRKAELARLIERQEREQRLVDGIDEAVIAAAAEREPQLWARVGRRRPRSVEDADALRTKLSDEIAGVIDAAQREMNGHTTSVQQQMGETLRRWPELGAEMDASIDAIPEFRQLHERVKTDDLPRFEREFHRQLNTESTKDLAGFNSWLNRQAEEIRGRVATINEALGAIDFNPGRIIILTAEPTINSEIREFKAELKAATGDLIGDELNAEQRFELVRVVLDKFRGREGRTDADAAWTARVTDVRNWYTFAATERDRETGTDFEHYTDSDGKSGGQKEKLAYTILAASLAYQFGLEWGVKSSKDFRFAVIDEAFGRGSDQSTRYALELFAKLGLQLLIVTPLQKVHVIEPYVSTIGFVENPEGKASRLHMLSVEEFRERRDGAAT